MMQPTRQTPAGRAYLALQNRARRAGRGTQELLTLYVVERWFDRKGRSSQISQRRWDEEFRTSQHCDAHHENYVHHEGNP